VGDARKGRFTAGCRKVGNHPLQEDIERHLRRGNQAVRAFKSVGEPIPWAKSVSAPFATADPVADKDSAIGYRW